MKRILAWLTALMLVAAALSGYAPHEQNLPVIFDVKLQNLIPDDARARQSERGLTAIGQPVVAVQ